MMWIVLIIAAFLCGSIPFGFLLGKAQGIDLRKHGSGNIGATNAGRVLGKRIGRICLILDILKGFVPAIGAGLAHGLIGAPTLSQEQAWLWLAVASAAMLGHIFPPWLAFKGGKGVATGFGAMLGVAPYLTAPTLGAAVMFVITVRVTRYVGLASCVAAVSLPLMTWIWLEFAMPAMAARDGAWPSAMLWVTAALGAMVIWRHRGNLVRMVKGTEPRAGETSKPKVDAP